MASANPSNVSRRASEPGGEICFLPAAELAALIRQKNLSAREVMEAHLRRIRLCNSKVNAIVTLAVEEELLA